MSASVSTAAPLNRGMITISVMLATVMQVVDTTIVNVALAAHAGQHVGHAGPDLVGADVVHRRRGDLHAAHGRARRSSRAQAPVRGGRHRLHARVDAVRRGNSLTQLVLFRALQGALGASLVPLSQAVLLDTYPREKHGSAMALWGMGVMVGPILGPTLGGYLTEYYSWRWAFYINLPVGMLALIGVIGVRAGGHERAETRLRLLRLRAAVDRDRRAAAHARPRQRARLVRLDRGRARSRDRGARVLSVPGPHVHGREAVHRAGPVRRPQLRGRRHADVHGRRAAARDDGAAAAVPPELARLPRDHGRLRARAARHRHDGRDDGGRPARRQSRHAPAGARRDSC